MTRNVSRNVPRATYRVQLHQGFGFSEALGIVPYLAKLGISHLYVSPLTVAPPGSTHGYDVIDPTRLNPELGTDEDFGRLTAALTAHDMGLLLDIVPNHMAVSVDNPWWRDVLANGRASRYANFFDIDWESEGGKIVLPILGRPLDQAIADGDVSFDGASIKVGGTQFPLAPGTNGNEIRSVLAQQYYGLSYWREETPNYRRFFEIDDLIGVRVEDAAVFEATHALYFRLLSEGKVQGLRVDHIDGLRDPAAYLHRLRNRATEAAGFVPYIVVEKVLAPGEELPADWPVSGSTGYDWLGVANGLLVDGRGMPELDRAYHGFIGGSPSFGDIVYERKRAALRSRFQREIRGLAANFAAAVGGRISEGVAAEAIIELSACLPVYRTYIAPTGTTRQDAHYLDDAARQALGRGAHADSIETLRSLLMRADDDAEALEFAMQWQQLTGAALAKGLEDSAFYRYNRLISLNEVGGHAEAATQTEFHRFLLRRSHTHPHTMNATSTHDTKRSEDMRARLAVLSEMPRQWETQVNRWASPARNGDAPSIDANTEYYLWQSAVGGWPSDMTDFTDYCERLKAYLLKSVREAGDATSWISTNAEYEGAIVGFVDWLATSPGAEALRKDLGRFVQEIDKAALAKSLSQVVLKIATPGTPDIYQGQEARDFSFVDPDNRRPVDFAERSRVLDDLESRGELSLRRFVRSPGGSPAKEFVTWRMLQLRQQLPDLFEQGEYLPLKASGDGADGVTAFARRHEDRWLIILAPRLTYRAPGRRVVPNTNASKRPTLRLPDGYPTNWRNVLEDRSVRVRGKTLSLARIIKEALPTVLLSE